MVLLTQIKSRGDWIYRLAVSPDGNRIAAVDGGINLYDVETNTLTGTLPDPDDQANTLAFSPDGKLLAVAGGGDEFEWNHRIRIYDSQTLELVADWNGGTSMGSNVRMVRFSGNGKLLVSCGVDAQVRLWDTSDWSMMHAFKGHETNVQDAWLSVDDSRIVSGGLDGKPRTWDVARREVLAIYEDHQKGRNYAVAISPDAKVAVSGGGGGQLCAWDAANAKTIATITVGDAVNYLAFTPSGNVLVAVLWGGPIVVIDTRHWNVIRQIEASTDRTHGHGLTPDGRVLVTASTVSPEIKLWDITQFEP